MLSLCSPNGGGKPLKFLPVATTIRKEIARVPQRQRSIALQLSPHCDPQTRAISGQAESQQQPRRRRRHLGYEHYIAVIHLTFMKDKAVSKDISRSCSWRVKGQWGNLLVRRVVPLWVLLPLLLNPGSAVILALDSPSQRGSHALDQSDYEVDSVRSQGGSHHLRAPNRRPAIRAT